MILKLTLRKQVVMRMGSGWSWGSVTFSSHSHLLSLICIMTVLAAWMNFLVLHRPCHWVR
jgi:hypothetical protein